MDDHPLSDWEKDRLKKYLHEDKDHTRGSLWIIFISAAVIFVVSSWQTQPWPRRGAGGGYGTNIAGPGITALLTIGTVILLAKLLRRRKPPQAPRL